jgi:transposase
MKKQVIILTDNARDALERVRDTHTKPYMRERAAAILKVASGASVNWVAQYGLLKRRYPKAVYSWVKSYLTNGLDGLYRKPYRRLGKLSPESSKSLEDMLHRPPYLCGQSGSRWTLAKIKAAFSALSHYTLSGIWRLLKRLDLRYKRGRLHLTSPDRRYNEKKAWIEQVKSSAKTNPHKVVTLFGDEKTYHRNPTSSCSAYSRKGSNQPKAYSTPGKNTQRRIGGVINVVSGSVWYAQRSTFGVKALVKEMYQVAAWVRQSHPHVAEINLIWDCWSCHYHPEVQLAASRAGITLIPLPTYAPWENPIEKLWRWLCQEVLHMHDCADAWRTLWQRVDNFLQQFDNGSQALLQYVGLLS